MLILYRSLLTLLLSATSGACYRYGGWDKGIRWVREIGVGICLVLETLVLGIFNWGTPFEMGSVWVESTYFKIKGKVYWILVGFSFSVATLPWLLWGGLVNHKWHWIGYSVRLVVCALFVYLWQMYWSNIVAGWFKTTKDVTDEVGRGAIQILTLPLLYL